jgi:hypothetical protein
MPQAEIRGYQPFKGLLTIQLKESCAVRVRIPDFVEPNLIVLEAGPNNRPKYLATTSS